MTFWTVILSADDEKQTRSHRIPTPKTPEPVIPPDGTQSERIAMLAAVGGQESGMGKGAGYNPVTHTGADGHGHGIWQMDDTYNPIADCERAGRDPYFAADQAAKKLSDAIAKKGFERGVQSYNLDGDYPALHYYRHVMDRYHSLEAELSKEQTRNGARR